MPTGCWGSVWLIRYWAERRQGGRSARLSCPAPASLPFWILGWLPGRDHRQIFSPRSLCRGWKRAGSKPLGLAGLPAAQGAGEEPAPSQGPGGIHPPGCAGRTRRIKPGRLWPLSPGSKGSGGLEQRWQPPGQCILLPPLSFTPAKLPGPTARMARGWRAPPPAGSVKHRDRAQHLGPATQAGWGLGGLGDSGHASEKNGFDSKVGDPDATAEHPGLPAGKAGASAADG